MAIIVMVVDIIRFKLLCLLLICYIFKAYATSDPKLSAMEMEGKRNNLF